MKKVLVTGAGGFIGSHLVEELVHKGCKVKALVHYNSNNSWGWLENSNCRDSIEVVSGDIRDADIVRHAMLNVDTVFHLAALIGIPYSYVSPEAYVETNIKGSLNIFQAAKDLGVKKIIHTSTSEIYGTAEFVPIHEKHPVNPQSPYAASKSAADFLALSFFRSFDLPVAVIRPFNTYGPRQSGRAIIPTIITQILSGAKKIKLGALTPTRDLTFVKDTVAGFIAAGDSRICDGEVINLGNNHEISVGDLARLIAKIMDAKITIVEDIDRKRPLKSEVGRLMADNSKAKKLLKWSPVNNLERGLTKTIKWFKEGDHLKRYKSGIYIMSDRIELDAPDIGAIEKEQVCAAIDSGFVSSFGPWVNEFERQFAQLVGAPCAVAIQSGTAALHMALHVLGIKTGDEVILPSTTFAATLHAVMYVKAIPVIVDVDRDTWCLSPDAFKAAITSRTKAVIPVHLYGNACDMEAITSIAAARGIFVVEDATESLGTKMAGRHLGTWGDIGCYSFNGNKMMTTGNGGMMVARSPDILERVVYLINQANPREGMEGYQEVGFNYRLPNLNAALGKAQLSRLDGFLKVKKAFHQIYETQLGKDGLCFMQKVYPGVEPSWWFTGIILKSVSQVNHVQEHLKNLDIPSRRIFKPLHTFGYAKNFQKGSCDNARMLYEQGLCLPSSTLNTEGMIDFVCGSIKQALM